jgi:FkbM family methyltransferase
MKAAMAMRPGGHVIDVGAWLGVATLYAAAAGAGKVLALETDPRIFDELWANVKLNSDLASRVFLYRHGISDRAETRTFEGVLGNTMWALDSWKKEAGSDEKLTSYQVQCSTLPSIAAEHGIQPADTAIVRLNAPFGMELTIAGQLLDWVTSAPEGTAKPAVWITLYTHKWGDKALGASTRAPPSTAKHRKAQRCTLSLPPRRPPCAHAARQGLQVRLHLKAGAHGHQLRGKEGGGALS